MEELLADDNSLAEKKPLSFTGKVLITITGSLGIGLSVLCAPFVLPAFRKYCLPFVPATDRQMIPKNAKGKLLDIGSGDGRIVIGSLGIGLSVLCAPFVLPAFRKYCLPFVPATDRQMRNVMSLLPKNAKGKLLDIGSGDGRIVIAAAKNGIESHGVELNSLLVLYSKLKAYREQTATKTAFFRTDLWKFNIRPYEYVIVFGVEQMMKDLEAKLLDEVRPGSKLIACRFPFPNLNPSKTIGNGVDAVWLYKMKTTDLNKK